MTTESINHFFVDETGDLTLFDRRGRIIVGEKGVSKYFMVGVAQVPDPPFVDALLAELRADLLADPYFRGVPSLRPEEGKTALSFHASKDPPEVRRDVMGLLPRCKAKVFVAIRRKSVLVAEALQARSKPNERAAPRNPYDDLVARLLRNLLHKADANQIVFARHAKFVRRRAMALAIKRAKANFERKTGIAADKPTDVQSAEPHDHGGLQVVDYYLWALQRMFEKGEDRYFELLRPAYRLVMDLDDLQNQPYGEWYSDENPLTKARIVPPAG